VNLVLNSILIPLLGSYGAAAASLTAEGVITYLYLKHGKEFFDPAVLWTSGKKKLLAGVIMCAVVYGIGMVVKSGFLCLLLQVGIGGCLYIALLTLMKDDLIQDVFRMIAGMRARFRKKSA
jgi:O-antigen/teichoic acid export membrane protein